ncbi:DUF3068 domain-containing protein [Streptomyces sp. LX-29]|uniref:DUF3068 domain-containing protein n=1 Tax=Streptomyces sp. LX-29 TaxID=2900152 RepID=UPI00240D6AEE|nr:DUF3068 domain-containing protein [Streptomyces sp. LX-29]WFB09739.1 DUF3068 domain-containing protein [Streptomyces sp. LX-29]
MRRTRPRSHSRPHPGSRTASPFSLAVLGLGTFLLVLAPMLAWYVAPRAQRTPTDTDVTTVFTGPGSYFDTAEVAVKDGQRLTVTRHVLGDVRDSERSGRAVWDVSTTIDSPQTLALKDPRRSLRWTVERWVTDRRTNAPVHCCGERPTPFQGEAYLKFPFDVQKRTYSWWDSTLGSTVPLRFAGVVRVQGHQGYRFTGSVRPTEVGSRQVPGRLVGRARQGQVQAEEWYANSGIELVADRRTGRIINARISPRLTLRAPGGSRDKVVLLRGEGLEFTEKTQRGQVALARDDNDRLELVGVTAPLSALATGVVLAAAGMGLVVRGRPPAGRS